METNKETCENGNASIQQAYTFAADAKLKECKYCRVMIPAKARICPNCKMVLKKYTLPKIVAAVLALAVIGVGGYGLAAYAGLLPDAALPASMVREEPAAVVAVTTSKNASGAKTVEPVDVTLAANLPELEAGEEPSQESVTQSIHAIAAEPVKVNKDTENSSEKEDEGSDKEIAKNDQNQTDNTAETDNVAETDSDAQSATQEKVQRGETASDDEAAEADSMTGSDRTSQTTKPEANEEADENERSTSVKADENERSTSVKADENERSTSVKADENERSTSTGADESADTDTGQDAAVLADMDKDEAAFREDCVQRSYKELLRNQEYLGTAVWLEVEVICQVDGGLFDENVYYLCKEEESGGIVRYYIIRDERAADETLILEGDVLTVYGTPFGSCKIPATLIETRPTAPALSMLYCDLEAE